MEERGKERKFQHNSIMWSDRLTVSDKGESIHNEGNAYLQSHAESRPAELNRIKTSGIYNIFRLGFRMYMKTMIHFRGKHLQNCFSTENN